MNLLLFIDGLNAREILEDIIKGAILCRNKDIRNSTKFTSKFWYLRSGDGLGS